MLLNEAFDVYWESSTKHHDLDILGAELQNFNNEWLEIRRKQFVSLIKHKMLQAG